MNKKFNLSIILVSLILLSGCTQKHRDTISDITYALTGVPGAKHKNNGNNNTTMKSKAQLEREKEEIEFKNRRQSWVGKSIDDLIMQRGSPFGVHKRQDGGSQYTFKKTQNSSNDPYLNNPRLCVDNFITDKKGIIKDWSSSSCLY
ncbi:MULTISPECIES: hypothetical protein [Providencia]|uniref:hypothetical protein n=1 Tax=Providencia TaxID=586 RepID=UPI00197F7AAC|nr:MULTISPECIES: hypothetical protein [Providencia]MBN4865140.1 hypothetical protein [Providencia stuartii]MBN4874634.1 hypothetical protein [Providencia stuartii]MBN4879153.1 hypothetical protein [Providencia stuartii]MBN4883835.1 hypothetical protein [Providencia stuartii]